MWSARLGLKACHLFPAEVHVFLLERVLEQQFLEEVGVGNDRVVLQVLRFLGGFLGELLADLRVDQPDRFVAEARPRVVAVNISS